MPIVTNYVQQPAITLQYEITYTAGKCAFFDIQPKVNHRLPVDLPVTVSIDYQTLLWIKSILLKALKISFGGLIF